MTYESEGNKKGRRPIIVFEMDVDQCTLVYGDSPCTAEVGVTGAAKCYNSRLTCQDAANFTAGTLTLRCVEPLDGMPLGEQIFSCIDSVSNAPTEILPEGMSIRGRADVSLIDFPHHDRGIDPYVLEDTATSGRPTTPPETRGTFFSKLIARFPLVNRNARVKTGYLTEQFLEDWETNFVTRHYLIDNVSSPDAGGQVRFTLKDNLKAASIGKVQYPAPSEGVLSAGISDSDTSLTMTPTGIGADYPASGVVRIGGEIIAYAGKTGDQLTSLARAQWGSTASAHSEDAPVQICVVYNAATAADVLYDLLTEGAGLATSLIDKGEWDAEAALRLPSYPLTRVVSVPTDINDSVTSVLESVQAFLWFDEIERMVRFLVVSAAIPGDVVVQINESENILEDSLEFLGRDELRLSRTQVEYDMADQTGRVEWPNLQFRRALADLSVENIYGGPRLKAIKSEWLKTEIAADNLIQRLLQRWLQPPQEVRFDLDARDAQAIKTGSIVDITSRQFVGPDGLDRALRCIVTFVDEVEPGTRWRFRAISYIALSGRSGLIGPDTLNDYDSESDANRRDYVFLCGDDGKMSNGDDGYVFV